MGIQDRAHLAARALGAVAMALLLVHCDDGGTDPNTDTYRVEGFVTDADSGEGIPGVSVTYRSDALDEASTETDEDGFYELEVVTHHPFGIVRAEKAGYEPRTVDIYFDTPIRRLDIALTPALGSD